ncbi:MAG: transposase [Desulfamplus sp.]|nr:transposase [Desulfamplus sp.]
MSLCQNTKIVRFSIFQPSNDAAATAVALSTETIKEQLINSDVVNFDESGLKVKSKLHWLHVASNEKLTHYEVHKKRGQTAMDDIAILPDFQGTAVHDHWKSYFAYNDCEHSLCNVHHLRELKFINENYGQTWAKDMSDLLIEIKKQVHSTKDHNDHLDSSKISAFEERYDKIVEDGLKANPPPEKQPEKKGKVKQSPPKNLLDRLKSHKKNVLLFMHDFRVPFDNRHLSKISPLFVWG